MTAPVRSSLTFRRRAVAGASIAISAAFAIVVLVEPVMADAQPKEWDVEDYDRCVDESLHDYGEGVGDDETLTQGLIYCCLRSGGISNNTTSDCSAPAVAASTSVPPPSEAANPDVPSGSPPPTKPAPTPSPKTPKTSLTLVPLSPVG